MNIRVGNTTRTTRKTTMIQIAMVIANMIIVIPFGNKVKGPWLKDPHKYQINMTLSCPFLMIIDLYRTGPVTSGWIFSPLNVDENTMEPFNF